MGSQVRTLLCLAISGGLMFGTLAGRVALAKRPQVTFVEAQGEKNGVLLKIKAPAKAVAGEAFPVEITLQNNSDKEIVWNATHGYFDWGILVKDEKQNLVERTRLGFNQLLSDPDAPMAYTAPPILHPLKPKQWVKHRFNLLLLYDLTSSETFYLTVQHRVNLFQNEFILKTEKLKFSVDVPSWERIESAPEKNAH